MKAENLLNKIKRIKENQEITIPSDDEFKDHLKGGAGDKKLPSEFDREELLKGIKDELEHTSDINIATEIAIDHLTNNPNYYSEMEK